MFVGCMPGSFYWLCYVWCERSISIYQGAAPIRPVGRTGEKGQAGSPFPCLKRTDAKAEGLEEVPRQPLLQYAKLYNQNPDLVGWLWIEGTGIDYPVMYRPGEPEFYLHRNFYGDPAFGGCLFMGEGYGEQGLNRIIYGHHMRDGSMFASLLSYGEQSFADAHPVIHFDTVYEEGAYQAVAAFYCDLEEGSQGDAYETFHDLSEKESFDEYMEYIQARNVMDTSVDVQFGDELITLSTCSYHTKNGRFVVTAKKMKKT